MAQSDQKYEDMQFSEDFLDRFIWYVQYKATCHNPEIPMSREYHDRLREQLLPFYRNITVSWYNFFNATSEPVKLGKVLNYHDPEFRKLYSISGCGSLYDRTTPEYQPYMKTISTLKKNRDEAKAKMKTAIAAGQHSLSAHWNKVQGGRKEASNAAAGLTQVEGAFSFDPLGFKTITQSSSLVTKWFILVFEYVVGNYIFQTLSDIAEYVDECCQSEMGQDLSDTALLGELQNIVVDRDELVRKLLSKWQGNPRQYPAIVSNLIRKIRGLTDHQATLVWFKGDLRSFVQTDEVRYRLLDLLKHDDLPKNTNYATIKKHSPEHLFHKLEEIVLNFRYFVMPAKAQFRHCDDNMFHLQLMRRVVVHSDTDSILPYLGYIPDWLNMAAKNRTEKIPMLSTQEIRGFLIGALFFTSLVRPLADSYCKLINVREERWPLIDGKYEFLDDGHVLAGSKKRRASHSLLQEGMDVDIYEIKGFDIIKSGVSDEVRDYIMKILKKNLKFGVDQRASITQMASLRKQVLKITLQDRNPVFSPVAKVKPANVYKLPWTIPQHRGRLLWNLLDTTGHNQIVDFDFIHVIRLQETMSEEYLRKRFAQYFAKNHPDSPPTEDELLQLESVISTYIANPYIPVLTQLWEQVFYQAEHHPDSSKKPKPSMISRKIEQITDRMIARKPFAEVEHLAVEFIIKNYGFTRESADKILLPDVGAAISEWSMSIPEFLTAGGIKSFRQKYDDEIARMKLRWLSVPAKSDEFRIPRVLIPFVETDHILDRIDRVSDPLFHATNTGGRKGVSDVLPIRIHLLKDFLVKNMVDVEELQEFLETDDSEPVYNAMGDLNRFADPDDVPF